MAKLVQNFWEKVGPPILPTVTDHRARALEPVAVAAKIKENCHFEGEDRP